MAVKVNSTATLVDLAMLMTFPYELFSGHCNLPNFAACKNALRPVTSTVSPRFN